MAQQSDQRDFLERQLLGNRHWGYVIYRTVYTPESEEAWDAVVAKLEAYMAREVDEEDDEEEGEEEEDEEDDDDDHGEGWMAKDGNYEGWMKASMNRLWDLWSQDEMEIAYPDRDPFTGEMRVYTGGGYSSEDLLYNSYMNWPPGDMDISSAILPPPPPRDPRIQDLAAMYERMKDRRPVGNPVPLPRLVHQPELDPNLSGITSVADPVWKAAQ